MTIWDDVVDVMAPLGCHEQRSRWGDKPALVLDGREIAHGEPDGTVDLRITGPVWRQLRSEWSDDSRVVARPGRRDWIELVPVSAQGVAELMPLLRATAEANRSGSVAR